MNAEQFIKYFAAFAGGAYAQHKATEHRVFRDPEFLAILDAALQGVSESDIEQLVNLSPSRLRDWAMAPKAMRPALLKKWASEPEISVDEYLAAKLESDTEELVRKNPDVLSFDEEGRLRGKPRGVFYIMWGDIVRHRWAAAIIILCIMILGVIAKFHAN